VRGNTTGFWVSTDGGANFARPAGYRGAASAAGINADDVYDVAVDPTDFNHVLVSFHGAWAWGSAKYGNDAGVMESKDGGTTWIIHDPVAGWGAGHAVKFLYDPALGIGNSQTWLLGTQGDGFWRTTNSGGVWSKVSDNVIAHGGGTAYYASSKLLYVSGTTMRSSDNGVTWTNVGPNSTWCVYGDGTTLYTGKSFGANQPYYISLETDGATWKAQNATNFPDGPYEMAYDAVNGIMYSSNWSSGLWALKVGPGDPDAGGTGGSTGAGGSVGTGGSTGAGGSVGTGGSTGAGGSVGTGGSTGAGGSVGTGGSTGAGGSVGTGGKTGAGGAAGVARADAGAAGTKQGTGGASGASASLDGSSAEPTGDGSSPAADSGCSCRVSTRGGALGAAPLFGLALLALVRRRRAA
jgi:MYXO-CTERM domain-containing protein